MLIFIIKSFLYFINHVFSVYFYYFNIFASNYTIPHMINGIPTITDILHIYKLSYITSRVRSRLHCFEFEYGIMLFLSITMHPFIFIITKILTIVIITFF